MKSELPVELETGVAWQDKQHRELYARAARLVIAVEHEAAADEALKLLDFLDEYVVVHFDDEERAMSKAGYVGVVSHIEEHHRFIDELEAMKRRFRKESASERIQEVRKNIKEWIENHLGVDDKELGRFLLKSGAR